MFVATCDSVEASTYLTNITGLLDYMESANCMRLPKMPILKIPCTWFMLVAWRLGLSKKVKISFNKRLPPDWHVLILGTK